MHLNSITPLTPSEKATKLGLTSSRFHASSISDNARDIIEDIKKKDRSDNKVKLYLDSWMSGHKGDCIIRMPLSNSSIPLRI